MKSISKRVKDIKPSEINEFFICYLMIRVLSRFV